jgi:hypothetical protein
VLLGVLLVEVQGIAKQLSQQRREPSAEPEARRMPLGVLLPVMAVLMVGLVVAFRVLWRGRADQWEAVVVWAALAVGLSSVVLPAVLALLPPGRAPSSRRRLIRARAWVPPLAGLAVGLAASPLAFGGGDVTGARFAVYGTCLSHGCGLKQRSGPGPAFREVATRLNDGELVLVVCQTSGPPPPRVRSRVWDRLRNGNYVSDAFVNTPNRAGGFSEELPRC